jgi:hypothetical protein
LQACRNRSEFADEDAFRPPRQQPRQIGLAKVQGQISQILAIKGQEIESVQLDFVVVLAGVQPVEIRYPREATPPRHPARTEVERLRNADSTMSG